METYLHDINTDKGFPQWSLLLAKKVKGVLKEAEIWDVLLDYKPCYKLLREVRGVSCGPVLLYECRTNKYSNFIMYHILLRNKILINEKKLPFFMILLYFVKVLRFISQKVFTCRTKTITMAFCRLLFISGQFNSNSTRDH